MINRFRLNQKDTALLIVDVQEKLFPHVERSCEVLRTILKLIQGFQAIHCPIFVSEQYPKGLGKTVAPILEALKEHQNTFHKTTFSCLDDSTIHEQIQALPQTQWIVVGLEAHICVLQTCRDLLNLNKHVVVINDAISSRSIYDFSTAIAELRDMGCRISSYETVLFELLKDSKDPAFRTISQIIQS